MFIQFGMDTEFELQQVDLHLRVLHVETILYHFPGGGGGGGGEGEGEGRREGRSGREGERGREVGREGKRG